MATYVRRDDWVTDAMGNAISGANVYVTSQPSNAGHFNDDGIWIPPSPLVQLYADPYGAKPISNPVQTDGHGHAEYYLLPGVYSVTYYSAQIVPVLLEDQAISGAVAAATSAAPSGAIDGVNTVFRLANTPSYWLLVYLNGVFQVPGVNYTISGGNTVTMSSAPEIDDQLWAVFQ